MIPRGFKKDAEYFKEILYKVFTMKRLIIIATLFLSIFGAGSARSNGFDLSSNVQEFTLPNGMKWLLVKRSNAPVFAGIVQVKVGGIDEPEGQTGIAHMLEHMLFKGSDAIGTKDFAKEKPYLEAIAKLGDLYQAEQRSAHPDKEKLSKIEKEIFTNLSAQREFIVPNELWQLFQRNGVNNLNAYTSKDVTTFHAEMPTNRFELWAYLISSMLFNDVPREFYSEKKVVLEERRNSVDNSPTGKTYEKFLETFFAGTPYSWPTIGTKQDSEMFSVNDIIKFYKKYYVPNNMIGAIVGDIDIGTARAVLTKYFGHVPAGKVTRNYTNKELFDQGEKRVEVKFPAKPFLQLAFHKPTLPSEDDYVFDVINYLLCEGKTSRLYQRLVVGDKLVSDIECDSSVPGARINNSFMIMAYPLRNGDMSKVEKVILEEIEKIKNEPIPPEELDKIRNRVATDFVWGLESNFGLAHQLVYFELMTGNWRYLLGHIKKINAIGEGEIRRVAGKYLKKDNSIAVTLVKQ